MYPLALGVVVLLIIIAAVTVWKVGTVSGVSKALTIVPEGLVPGQSLFNRLGGIYPIAAVVDHFSDAILRSPVVGVDSPNPQLREWSRNQKESRLPGLKFMRTLWVCDVTGGPCRFFTSRTHRPGKNHVDLTNVHRNLRITSAEFDEVARILSESLDWGHVPAVAKGQVLAAFAAHKDEVTAGSR